MNYSFMALLGIFLICEAQNLGFGPKLKCYRCNSMIQDHCDDPFDAGKFTLETCPNNGQNYSRCMKKVVECKF